MAMLETKIIQINNSEWAINESNERWGRFGWNVLITHSQDTKTYTQGTDYYTGNQTVETTTINYATITYQRDKCMKNYAQIAALEQEYEQTAREIRNMKEAGEIRFFPGLLITLFLVFVWPLGLLYVAYKIYEVVKKDKVIKENRSKIEKCEERMEQILSEAAELLVM